MGEVIVRMTSDHIKIKGGEYVKDLIRCEECDKDGICVLQSVAKNIEYCGLGTKEN